MALSERDLRDIHDGALFSTFKDRYWQKYQDVWNFHREFFVTMCHGHDDYWEVLERTMQEIKETYNNDPLVCELLNMAYKELERVWNERVKINAIFGEKKEVTAVE